MYSKVTKFRLVDWDQAKVKGDDDLSCTDRDSRALVTPNIEEGKYVV